MKKLLSIILALLMLVIIVASCGNYENPADTGGNGDTTGGGNSNLGNDPENKPSDEEKPVLPEGIASVKINEYDANAEFVLCDKESSFTPTEAFNYCNNIPYETENTRFDISIDFNKSYPTEVNFYSASIMKKGNLQSVYSVDNIDSLVSSFQFDKNKIEMFLDLDREEISEQELVVIEIEINYENQHGFLFIGIKKAQIETYQAPKLLINGDEAEWLTKKHPGEQDYGIHIPIERYYEKAYSSNQVDYFATIEFYGALPKEITDATISKKEVGTGSDKNLSCEKIKAEIRGNMILLEFSLDQKITSDVFYIINVIYEANTVYAIQFAIKSLD